MHLNIYIRKAATILPVNSHKSVPLVPLMNNVISFSKTGKKTWRTTTNSRPLHLCWGEARRARVSQIEKLFSQETGEKAREVLNYKTKLCSHKVLSSSQMSSSSTATVSSTPRVNHFRDAFTFTDPWSCRNTRRNDARETQNASKRPVQFTKVTETVTRENNSESSFFQYQVVPF